MNINPKATIAVVAIGVIKTFAVQEALLDGMNTPTHISLAIFAAATLLTGLVVAELFRIVMKSRAGPARAQSYCPAPDEQCKEDVIRHYRNEWNLSAAEVDVANFALKGFSNNEIASLRNTTVATVKSQLSAVYQKSGLKSRYQLIAFVTDEMFDDNENGGGPARQKTAEGARRERASPPKPWTVVESRFVAGETANQPGALAQRLRGSF